MHEHRTSVPVATFQDPQRATIPCEELLGHASHSVTFHRPDTVWTSAPATGTSSLLRDQLKWLHHRQVLPQT